MTVKMFSDCEAITFSREGRILTVTLNRADTLNAVNAKLHAELARVFTGVQRDPESDVVVLTGAGRAFFAGGDVDWMQDAIDRRIKCMTDRCSPANADERECG
jgi:enoyl-CoA hydratase